jgi:lipoyl synthase
LITEMKEKSATNNRLPSWLYRKLAPAGNTHFVAEQITELGLHTVCESALCPNRQECWSRGTATFMILGDVCTRACGFCAVKNGIPLTVNPEEPMNVALAVKKLNLRHVVVTSVARDELKDEGANQFAQTIRAIYELCPQVTVEVLIPDFSGRLDALEIVANAKPDILNHNIETVRRLTGTVRAKATYDTSLSVLHSAHKLLPDSYIKSGIMLGLGESDDEVEQTLLDLLQVNCDILTIGQYIRPTRKHLPVAEYHTPEKFRYWKERGIQLGFKQVVSSPLTRSSYHAEEILHKNLMLL